MVLSLFSLKLLHLLDVAVVKPKTLMVRESSAQTTPIKSPNNNNSSNISSNNSSGNSNNIFSPTNAKRTDESIMKSEQSVSTTDQQFLIQEKRGMHKSELSRNGLENVARKKFQLSTKQELPSTTEEPAAHNSIAPNPPPPPPPPLLSGYCDCNYDYDYDGYKMYVIHALSVQKECCRFVLLI